MDPRSRQLDEFLAVFWRDYDAGSLQPLDDYLQRFPECPDEVRREYAGVTAGADAVATGDGRAARSRRSIGRYLVKRRLARGGMGMLLLAEDPELHRMVVLKTLRGRRAGAATVDLERLRQEARLGGRLDCEGLCPVLDVVSDQGRLFVVMPYVEGDDLSVWIERARERRVPDGETAPLAGWASTGDLRPVMHLVEDVARAVHFAHEAGIVHRDLKPGNIRVRPNGAPVVVDFGLAIDATVDRCERLTVEGALLGSPHYMAPEQIEGRLDGIDRRTDVYALGVILYELLTLEPPFHGDTRTQLLQRVLRGEPVPPSRRQPSVPRDLDTVCLRAMATEAHRRYATALELAEELERVRTLRAPLARPESTLHRWVRLTRRNPIASSAIAVALALVLVVCWTWSRAHSSAVHAAAAAAVSRIVTDRWAGRAPDPQDEALLEQALGDRRTAQWFAQQLEHGDVRAAVTSILQTLDQRLRGPDDEPEVVFARPRGAVATARPAFAVRRPATQHAAMAHFVLEAFGREPIAWDADIGGDATFTAELPAGVTLLPDEYRASVTFPSTDAPPAQAVFRVVPAGVRDAILAEAAAQPDRLWAAISAGARLLAGGLAEDAVQLLTAAPADDRPGLVVVRDLLLARGYGVTGDGAALQAMLR